MDRINVENKGECTVIMPPSVTAFYCAGPISTHLSSLT